MDDAVAACQFAALDINQPRFVEPAAIFALGIGVTIVINVEEHDLVSHRIGRRTRRFRFMLNRKFIKSTLNLPTKNLLNPDSYPVFNCCYFSVITRAMRIVCASCHRSRCSHPRVGPWRYLSLSQCPRALFYFFCWATWFWRHLPMPSANGVASPARLSGTARNRISRPNGTIIAPPKP